ncbi:putative lysozyme-like protein [Anopheles bellator]|uniref:putative lysozyme-like protein n=1 Tax=Anopheles bellator TaxID=139047 RepID=UPI00264781EB|nr:putative lysozyme-like protein [Anopheles bellator]
MKVLLVTAVICGAVALVLGVPLPAANPAPEPAAAPGPDPVAQPKTDIELMKIPLDDDKELDVITLINSEDQQINERNKRTIGILRELFPSISQILDQKIQMITSYLFRTIGPILLRSGLGLGGGGAGGGGGDSNRGSSGDDDDDDFDFDDDDDSSSSSSDTKKPSSGGGGGSSGPKVSISLPTFPPSTGLDDADDDGSSSKGASSTAATTTISGTSEPELDLGADGPDDRNEVRKRATSSSRPAATAATVMTTADGSERIDLLADLSQFDLLSTGVPPTTVAATMTTTSESKSNLITTSEDANTLDTLDLAGLSDTLNAIRRARATEEKAAVSGDQNAAESSANSSSLDELTLDSEGTDEDRNKRFLSFGGSSGGGGGSGNFLFDIIRRAADRAARAAGTVYRVVAGTESLTTALETDNSKDDGHSTTSHSATSHSHSSLVSGSSGTEQSDEKAHSPDDHDLGKGDGYTEGIPGPVTRLFVLANRGLSNLIQDLILRIAQTSERVVNFKARLITSLI